MEDRLLEYMQWPEIEAIIYSEHDLSLIHISEPTRRS